MPLSAAVRGDLVEAVSALIEPLFPVTGAAVSFGLHRDVLTSVTCTVRSGTSFLFVAALFVCSNSGALSEDFPTAFDAGLLTVVDAGALFFPALVVDRRLKEKGTDDEEEDNREDSTRTF